MSLVKARGNMYEWVTHMHSHLRGKCSHECSYCYAADHERRWQTGAYSGDLRVKEDEFEVNYGENRTIFIEHTNDLFAKNVPLPVIAAVVAHCYKYPKNTYVFQTKNPERYSEITLPRSAIRGTTIESNRFYPEIMRNAPAPEERYRAMKNLDGIKFVTIEPVLDFDVDVLARWIGEIQPTFANLGADSKGHKLPEPPIKKITQLVEALKPYGIELREKYNLDRLMKRQKNGT